MHDFNYFQPYHKGKGKTNWPRLLGFIVVLVVLGLVAINVLKMVISLNALKGEVASLEARLNDPQLMEIAQEVGAAEAKLAGLRFDGFTVGAMKAVVDYDTVFDYDKLETIIDRLVDDSFLESLNYTGRQLSLRGLVESDALASVAQLVYNLRDSEEYKDFNVSMISRASASDDGTHVFQIEFVPVEYADETGR
ncbi:MAG TPA: PilN domain-containing protein [Bacillota bacterium]|jgi:hypothetical protein|nr:PilN domain-containing protein [Fastidiosipila sp.]HPX93459.1 PilN domain-containing protein [Bacillota bacterium]HQB81230.1 PilN domain-containing protein [Bacillota bacterium]